MKPKPYPKTWSRELRISLYESDARAARLKADLERRTVTHAPLSWLGAPIAVGVIDIPIWEPQSFYKEQKTEMTTAEKLTFIKQNLPLAAQVNTQCAAHSSTFDPRPTFRNASINVLFPAAPRDDFSDDRSNSAADGDDDTTEHSNLGMAHDLISCEISGEAGPGCGHNGVDHIQRAIDCLTNYARDEAMRDRNRADAARAHTVRFAS